MYAACVLTCIRIPNSREWKCLWKSPILRIYNKLPDQFIYIQWCELILLSTPGSRYQQTSPRHYPQCPREPCWLFLVSRSIPRSLLVHATNDAAIYTIIEDCVTLWCISLIWWSPSQRLSWVIKTETRWASDFHASKHQPLWLVSYSQDEPC